MHQQNRKLGNEMVAKLKEYELKNGCFPDHLTDIGYPETEQGPIYYEKRDATVLLYFIQEETWVNRLCITGKPVNGNVMVDRLVQTSHFTSTFVILLFKCSTVQTQRTITAGPPTSSSPLQSHLSPSIAESYIQSPDHVQRKEWIYFQQHTAEPFVFLP